MARKVKCLFCGEQFDRDSVEFVQIKNRYAHKDCFEKAEANKSQEEKDLKELEEYIMKIFNESFINARIRQQIKRMREQYNYSYSGILKSLIYFFEVRKNPIERANGGIGIVPYVYEDARKYYYNLYMAQKKNENKKVGELVLKGREIRIKPPMRRPKEVKLFNLEDEEEENN